MWPLYALPWIQELKVHDRAWHQRWNDLLLTAHLPRAHHTAWKAVDYLPARIAWLWDILSVAGATTHLANTDLHVLWESQGWFCCFSAAECTLSSVAAAPPVSTALRLLNMKMSMAMCWWTASILLRGVRLMVKYCSNRLVKRLWTASDLSSFTTTTAREEVDRLHRSNLQKQLQTKQCCRLAGDSRTR